MHLLSLDLDCLTLQLARKVVLRVATVVGKDPALVQFGQYTVEKLSRDVTLGAHYIRCVGTIAKKAGRDGAGKQLLCLLFQPENRLFVDILPIFADKKAVSPSIFCAFSLATIEYCLRTGSIPVWMELLGTLPENEAFLTEYLTLMYQSGFQPAYIEALESLSRLQSEDLEVFSSFQRLLSLPNPFICARLLAEFSKYVQEHKENRQLAMELLNTLCRSDYLNEDLASLLFEGLNKGEMCAFLLVSVLLGREIPENPYITGLNSVVLRKRLLNKDLQCIEQFLSSPTHPSAGLVQAINCDSYLPSLEKGSFRLFNVLTKRWTATTALSRPIRYCEATSYLLLNDQSLLSCGGSKQ